MSFRCHISFGLRLVRIIIHQGENTVKAKRYTDFPVPFELHIFEKGEHGLSRVSDELIWSKRKFEREYPWLSLSVDWLNQLF